MTLLLVYLFLALVVSFLCSIMESVLLSTPQAFLLAEQEKGVKWSTHFLELKNNIDKPLSAILSLNTVAHTIGAAGVGAQAIKVFGEASFGIVSAVLTILILVITEIIPKTMGANYWRSFVKPSYHIIRFMIFITYPLVLMSAFITKLISNKENEKTISREEIAALASIGTDEGIITVQEARILKNLLKLRHVKAKEILTPRVVLALANEELSVAEFLEHKEYLRFSRIPIYTEKEDDISGYVIRQQVLEKIAEEKDDLKLKDIKRPITIVPNSLAIFSIWERLISNKEQIALIVDEYGGVDGIITMEDIIETLLGFEILDEKDEVSDMQKYARERWNAKKDEERPSSELSETETDSSL